MKVKFIPNDVELEIKQNQSVLELAHDNGIHIQSVCKGVPSCAECRIQIKDGEHNVIPPSPAETSLIGTAQFVDNSRLACQLKCFGDIVVDLHEQIEKEKRATGSKRPRGASENRIEGTSNARTGNVIFDEKGKYNDRDERVAETVMLKEEIKLAKQRLKKGKNS